MDQAIFRLSWVFRIAAFIAITLGIISSPAIAATIMFDQSLDAPGWYNGSGNPNGGFTVTTEHGITAALRVKGRQNPNVIHSPDGYYSVPAGSQPGVPTRAWWNWEDSLWIDPLTGLDLADVLPFSTITVEDRTTGHSNTVPYIYRCDNSYHDGTTESTGSLANFCGSGMWATHFGTQNSGNPTFGDFPLNQLPGYTFDMNAEHHYRFIQNIGWANGLLFSNRIDVLVGDAERVPDQAPEPASMALLGVAALGFGLKRRQRRQ